MVNTMRKNNLKIISCFLCALLSLTLLAFALPASPLLQHSSTASFVWGAQFEVVGYDAARPALTNFPVLVRIANDSPSGFSYSQMQLQDGDDLCFVGMDGTGLPFEIDTWDPRGTSLVWVALPIMTNGTQFVMCWGSKTSGKAVCADNPFADYKGVWHLNSVDPADSSPSGYNGTHRTDNLSVVDGLVGAAVNVPRTSDSDGITCGQGPTYSALAEGFTIEGWCRPTQYSGLGNGAAMFGETGFVSLRIYSATRVTLTTPGRSDHHMDFESGVLPAAKTWWHFAATFKRKTDGNGLNFYVNGQLLKSLDSSNISNTTVATELLLGNNQWDQAFKGDLDEMRLSASIRSADWIAADYATQSEPAFLTAGTAGLLDAGAPMVSDPAIVRNADGSFTVSVVVSSNDAASVSCVLDDGGMFPMTTADMSLPKTYAATLSGLAPNTTFAYSVQTVANTALSGTNVLSGPLAFYTGDLSVEKIADGDEDGLVPGVFRISRGDAANDLVVDFEVGGTAVEGRSYQVLAHTATIPAGTNAVDVAIHPLIDPLDQSMTVDLTLLPGLYGVSASAGSASLTITNLTLSGDSNTWIAEDAGLASDGSNWSFGHAPRAYEHVLFDGRFSNADCEWDDTATHEVAAWTQTSGYTGTVTVCTVFPGKGDFECLIVAGAMTIDAGSVTHPQSRRMDQCHDNTWDWLGDLKANETYRLRVSAGSLHVGADGLIDARGKGYYVTDGGSRMRGCSHGGRLNADSPPCYGDPREPIHIGLPFHAGANHVNGKGGGAVYLVVSGAAVVDGIIRADAWDASVPTTYSERAGAMGAAGSVFLRADTLSGTGRITAIGSGATEEGLSFPDLEGRATLTDGHYKGTGGRVAIVTREPVDRSTFGAISAEGSWMGSPDHSWTARQGGGSGTVVFIDETRPNGLLVVAQQANAAAPSLDLELDGKYSTFWRCPAVTDEGDWTFDAIEFGHRGFLRVPAGTRLTLPGGLASCYGTETSVDAIGGLRYEGGMLDIGDGDQTISGNWMFVPWTNFVFQASVFVTNGAAIGFHPLTNNRGTNPDLIPICSAEIRGDLTIATNGYLRAKDCGVVKESETNETGFASPLLGSHSHGGRSVYLGRDPDGRMISQAYDSVFDPRFPGCSASSISGQQCGGVIRLVVDGTLTLDGTATVSGGPEERSSSSKPVAGGAGGALSLEAGRFAGTGTIQANGGNRDDYDGPGGRIAIRLSAPGADFTAFTGRIEAGGGSWWKGGTNILHDASAGTVYLETAADGDKCGIIRIAMDPLNIAYIEGTKDKRTPHDNTNTTEMVSLGYGGDDPRDYKHVRYEIADYGRAAVNADVKVRSVLLADNTAALDLEGHELTVKEFYWVSGAGAGTTTNHLRSGKYSAARLSELGISSVEDSSPEKSGKIVVNRGKLTLTIR